jgi:uncharacterized protein (DUF488 family)
MLTVYTIGHSTRGLEEFIGLLGAHGVGSLVDVRHFPGSRRFPHFSGESLAAALPGRGIAYFHLPELGGRRRPAADSPNTAWRNGAFRGYADYMGTAEFGAGLERLLEIAGGAATAPAAMMCAEAVWWRCHRGLIADVLKSRGHTVLHIEGMGPPKPHPYTSAARIVDGALSYADPGSLFPG